MRLLFGLPALRACAGGLVRGLRLLRARYDAAQSTDNNRRHWANADGLSANAANSPEVRRTLRNRSRYEVANNSYARGIVLTLANDCIGAGPRLQMLTPDRDANSMVEKEFSRWAAFVALAEKLRTMRMAKAEDGEAFAILTNNAALPAPIKLDLRLVEADQVATPDPRFKDENAVDGIVLDQYGNPVEYHLLRQHPGNRSAILPTGYDRLPASSVLHYFRLDRPGQNRGIPELTSALPLFALLRDYTLATLDAAKAAAYFAGILYTDAPPNGESESIEPMDAIELERNMLLTMPGDWKMGQVHAEQPGNTYGEFKHEILNEIARCLNMPFNVAAANSSGYNYASGRLDHQTYFKSIRVEQSHIESVVLDRLLAHRNRPTRFGTARSLLIAMPVALG
jgi:capsid protein